LNGTLLVDEFVTATVPLNEINEAFHMMHKGQGLRTIVQF